MSASGRWGADHMGLDQYGNTWHSLGPFPRKALLDRLGYKRAERIYCDRSAPGGARETEHVGWKIGPHWITVLRVEPLTGADR